MDTRKNCAQHVGGGHSILAHCAFNAVARNARIIVERKTALQIVTEHLQSIHIAHVDHIRIFTYPFMKGFSLYLTAESTKRVDVRIDPQSDSFPECWL